MRKPTEREKSARPGAREGTVALTRKETYRYAGLDLGSGAEKVGTLEKTFTFLYRMALAALFLGGAVLALSHLGLAGSAGASVQALRSTGVYLASGGGLAIIFVYLFIPERYYR